VIGKSLCSSIREVCKFEAEKKCCADFEALNKGKREGKCSRITKLRTLNIRK
jgi:hypothetical protein